MNENILDIDVQDFIRNYSEDISKLAFSGSPFKNISVQELIQQIESFRKCKDKLPTWYSQTGIYYPPKLNLEQTSSEITAQYKASLINGNSIADITGGFGVDSYFFSEKFERVNHFEINEELSAIAKHNFLQLSKSNVQCSSENGLEAVLKTKLDIVYADPSRRHDSKGKVFFLNDCEPNIPKHLDDIIEHCDLLLVKTSPMLDITVGLRELKFVKEIHIIAVENEVKELLWLIKKDSSGTPNIKTINISKNNSELFDFDWEQQSTAEYSLPQQYLYEPNAAIMKSGAFNLVSEKFGLKKLQRNTHLYTSEILKEFPGRRFLIENIVPYKKSEMKDALKFKKANIAIRNFPEQVSDLRKKWKIADGGQIYLFFITNMDNEKQMLVCSKK